MEVNTSGSKLEAIDFFKEKTYIRLFLEKYKGDDKRRCAAIDGLMTGYNAVKRFSKNLDLVVMQNSIFGFFEFYREEGRAGAFIDGFRTACDEQNRLDLYTIIMYSLVEKTHPAKPVRELSEAAAVL